MDMPRLDTRRGKDLMGTFLSDIVLQVLSFVAENERKNIRQRQAEGIAAAKARGVRFGRPMIEVPECFEQIVDALEKKEMTLEDAVRLCGMSKTTLYRRMRDHQLAQKKKKVTCHKVHFLKYDTFFSHLRNQSFIVLAS